MYARGSGKINPEYEKRYGCPYAFESAFITLKDSDITIEMERFLYGVARSYSECFRIYGENMSFEWQQLASEKPVLYHRTGDIGSVSVVDGEKFRYGRGSDIVEQRIEIPDYGYRLPEEIRHFTRRGVYDSKNMHLSFKQGGGHGGSHPHLVHEFVSSIIEERSAVLDDIMGAYWTGVGICAHESAMQGGVVISVPEFEKLR